MNGDCLRLASIASDALAVLVGNPTEYLERGWAATGRELAAFLQHKNGFYAFESSLLVRPFSREQPPLGLVEWNELTLWKKAYRADLSGVLFFAEVAFGHQFAIATGQIYEFDPETSEFKKIANSLGQGCSEILQNHSVRTGFRLAHAWQVANGPLLFGSRLLPKRPFALGGKYSLENLYPLADVEGMLFRATISNQLTNVPDGSRIILKKSPDQLSD